MTRPRTLLSFLAVPLLALLIACGGGDDDSSSSDDGGDSGGSSSSQSGNNNSGGGSSNNSSSNNPFSNDDCEALVEFAGGFGASFAGPGSDIDLEDVANLWDELADRAPNEIKADMRVVADALGEFWEILDDLDVNLADPASFGRLTPAQQADLARASEAFDDDRLSAAIDKVGTYFEDRCS